MPTAIVAPASAAFSAAALSASALATALAIAALAANAAAALAAAALASAVCDPHFSALIFVDASSLPLDGAVVEGTLVVVTVAFRFGASWGSACCDAWQCVSGTEQRQGMAPHAHSFSATAMLTVLLVLASR